MIALRPYQSAAVEAVYRHLRDHDDNPVVVIPTGGGKTPVMATICDDAVRRWDGRVLVLAHVKELLEQTAGTLTAMAGDLDVGVYSAGLRRRDTGHPVIVAGIQSVYRRAGDLFAQLREYTLAVVAAAKSAAHIAILMKTDAPAGGEAAEVEPMTEMEFEPNMAVFTPEGWEPSQVKAEQPATTYDMFKREILNEIARCLNMPYNIAACNSSGYNYASGRLDHQTYFKSIRVEQTHCETVVLDRILAAWLAEAVKVFGLDLSSYAKASEGDVAAPPHQWFWDGHEHVDPAKEANAQATRLAANTTTLASEYARQGKDWETELRQRAKEIALMNELGLSSEQALPQSSRRNAPDGKDEPKQEEPDQEDKEEGRAAA
ncbi:MAG: DEAD/DEAH box helicase family protein [Phycisphaerae bacterium]